MARKFERKAVLRDSWLKEMAALLSEAEFGKTAGQVEAALKKHQAISADILPRVSANAEAEAEAANTEWPIRAPIGS